MRGIDKPLRFVRRFDKNSKKYELNVRGVRRGQGHVSVARNVVFESTDDSSTDWVGLALD